MTEYYVDFVVNLDERDSEGKPKYAKIPKHDILIFVGDTLHFTICVIENGVETVVARHTVEGILSEGRPSARETVKI